MAVQTIAVGMLMVGVVVMVIVVALVVTMATGVGIHSSSDGDGGDAMLLKIIANKATSRIELVFKGREQV
jgi:hypothetical protein